MKAYGVALMFALLLIAGGSLSAAEAAAGGAAAENYESLMITIWDDAPDYQEKISTYGVKIGILGCFGAPVYGVEAAVIAAGSDEVTGFKGALGYTDGRRVAGVALAPVNFVDHNAGVAIGAVNVAKRGGLQIGILNFMENGFLPFFPIVNFSL